MNSLKASVFATGVNDTYLALDSSTITDTAFTPNKVTAIGTSVAIQAQEYTADVVNPEIFAYTLNLNNDQLTLTFNEPVDPNTADCTLITIHNSTLTPLVSVALTGCEININEIISGVEVLTLNLNQPDLTEVKANINLATSMEE